MLPQSIKESVFLEPIIAALAALFFLLILTPLAKRLSLMDIPDNRKRHGMAVPTVGGLAIYLVMLMAIFILDFPDKLSWLLISGSILVVTGSLDDAFGLGIKIRFLSQIFAALIMVFGGGLLIQKLGLDTLDSVGLPHTFGLALTIFAVVGLTNAFNMVDGIDGLAIGHAFIAISTVALTLYFSQGSVLHSEWLGILLGAIFSVWLVNLSLTPFRRVFLGDAGSILLGFTVAWILVYYSQKPISLISPVSALWCVTIPVFDALTVIMRRVRVGRSPFSADRSHLHHILIDSGLSTYATLIIILVGSSLLNLVGVLLTYQLSPGAGLIFYAATFIGYEIFMLNRTTMTK